MRNPSRGVYGEGPLLLYDGACGFCAASVQFVLRHERQHSLRFAALDSDIGAAVRARHPDLRGIDSMIWVDGAGGAGERVLTRSAAGLEIARYLGGPWRLAAIGQVVPRVLRDVVYDFIARHRHSLVGVGEQCLTPPAAVRARFLDLQ